MNGLLVYINMVIKAKRPMSYELLKLILVQCK